MRKILSISLLVMFISMGSIYAAAPVASKARSTTLQNGVEAVMGIGDVSSGNTPEVTAAGAFAITNIAREVTSQWGDGQIYTGACFVQGIYIEGESAGDYAAIFDNTSATGTAKFDPRISTNTRDTYIDTKGAYFSTGIYVDAIDNDVFVTAVYDY